MNLRKLTKEQKQIRRRILEISYKHNYSHIGSCLSAVDLLIATYHLKNADERFVLSSGHAGVALYAVLEKYQLLKPEITDTLFVHPDRNKQYGIDVSTGSLGQGLPIATGIALVDRTKNVYCVISDGECAEGSIWEALSIACKLKLDNLKIVLNANGWGAYDPIALDLLKTRINAFGCIIKDVDGHNLTALKKALKTTGSGKPLLIFARTRVDQLPFLSGVDAHYYKMTQEDYQESLKLFK